MPKKTTKQRAHKAAATVATDSRTGEFVKKEAARTRETTVVKNASRGRVHNKKADQKTKGTDGTNSTGPKKV